MVTENKNIYTDLERISIYNFHKAIKGDLTYLIVDRSKEEKQEDLEAAKVVLLDAESVLNYNSDSEIYYNSVSGIEWLKKRLTVVPVLLNLLFTGQDIESVVAELKKWKIYISVKKPITPQIEKTITILNNSRNKIKRNTDDLISKNKTGVNEMSLQKMAIKINKALGINPDIFKDSVVTWYAYFEEVNEIKKN